ncbi:NAD(P)-binding protein [Hypoxylon sp. FL0890]|nr:NAD(P)-binding protein [Hypoxylon sp. FL0890]
MRRWLAQKGMILVTGANGGLGRVLLGKIISTTEFIEYYGVYTVRNTSSVSAIRSTLAGAPATHHYAIEPLDLSWLGSVYAFSRAINARVLAGEIPSNRSLILNARNNDMGKQSFAEDGFDETFAPSYLGHWLLALMLLQSVGKESGRIAVAGSATHERAT